MNACRVFSDALAAGGIVKAIRVPDGQRISNARVKPKGDIAGDAEPASCNPTDYFAVPSLSCILVPSLGRSR